MITVSVGGNRAEMSEDFDVAVVGARCAGSPLAIKLARAGVRTVLIDKDEFPSDTPSTHFFQAEGLLSLQRLGVMERLKSTGAPIISEAHNRIGDLVVRSRWPTRPGDVGGAMCVRRPVLDTILVQRAREVGVEVRTGTRAMSLIGNGRVRGVRVRDSTGREVDVTARLVAGADGRGSLVARQAGARAYNITANERAGFWAYYDGVPITPPVTAYLHRWDEEFVIATPTDSGLFLVIILAPVHRLAAFRADSERTFEEHVARDGVVSDIVAGHPRTGRLFSVLGFTGYFRESAGPGWVLVGDAGHFKDPAPAQGISDALRQVDRLAPAIIAGLGRGEAALDAETEQWWRWRDEDAAEKYWFAQDLGRGGPVPLVFAEMTGRLHEQGRITELVDVFNHRRRPSTVLTPARLLGAAARLSLRGDALSRQQILRETRGMLSREMQRRRLNRQPVYAPMRQQETPAEIAVPA
ncbi:MAG: FAD-dependent monooxygenase [Chloroflexi bacterium]|nr:MAG: FAD-dependent monooxygenase [Chloroflexota bacterium]